MKNDRFITCINGKWTLKDKNGKVLLQRKGKESFQEFEKRCAEYKKSKKKETTIQFKKWNCRLVWHRYGNNRRALELVDVVDGSPVVMATVNLPDEKLDPDEVFIKDYSENDGLLDALMKAGIVEDTGRRVTSGYVTIPVCRLLI